MNIRFSAEIEVPDGTPLAEIEAWLEFELGATGQLAAANQMAHTDLESSNAKNVWAEKV